MKMYHFETESYGPTYTVMVKDKDTAIKLVMESEGFEPNHYSIEEFIIKEYGEGEVIYGENG